MLQTKVIAVHWMSVVEMYYIRGKQLVADSARCIANQTKSQSLDNFKNGKFKEMQL